MTPQKILANANLVLLVTPFILTPVINFSWTSVLWDLMLVLRTVRTLTEVIPAHVTLAIGSGQMVSHVQVRLIDYPQGVRPQL